MAIVKIGYAKDVDGRISDSQCFCPPCVTLVLFKKFKVPSAALKKKWEDPKFRNKMLKILAANRVKQSMTRHCDKV